ncbi:UNVERIFIED_CONTAM: 50S ribosomal protein L9, partial [Prevotella sp. 15_C9]
PTVKGVIASPSANKQLAEYLKLQADKIASRKAEAEKRAAKLSGVELVITAKVSATFVTNGSVNTEIVDEELPKKVIEIER